MTRLRKVPNCRELNDLQLLDFRQGRSGDSSLKWLEQKIQQQSPGDNNRL